MKNISRLNGKRAVPLLRCSTMEQADTSIDDQLDSIKVFAERHGLELAPEIRLAGKSGSIKKNLDEMVDQVIDRKQRGERIDAVVFYDQSRFGRSGPMHFGQLASRLEDEGIELAETDCYIEDTETAGLLRMLRADAARRQAKGIAEASARGSQSSLQAGRRSHSTRSSYGIDKLYSTTSGDAICIIRKLADGTRLRLDPKTFVVIEKYPKGIRGYKKGSLEIDTLVPGDPKLRDIIIRMFRLHHEQGYGGQRIARELNESGIPSPNGSHWAQAVIDAILLNEVYTGFGYANRFSNAIYCNQSPGTPIPVNGPPGRTSRGIRPIEDWHCIEYPELAKYLPEDVRRLAMISQSKNRDRIAAGKMQIKKHINGRRKHLLSGLIHEKTTGMALKAISSGPGGRIYYGLADTSRFGFRPSPLRSRLPSGPLHRVVLEEIEQIFCSATDLRPMLIESILIQDQKRRGGIQKLDQLLADRDRLGKKFKSQLNQLGSPDDDAVRDAMETTKKQIRNFDIKIENLNAGPALTTAEVEQIVGGIISEMESMLKLLAEDGDLALRNLAESMIGSAVADLKAGEVEFEFVVSSKLIEKGIMGLAQCPGPATWRQAHKWKPIVLDGITVDLPERCYGDCWKPFKPNGCSDCKRKRMAA